MVDNLAGPVRSKVMSSIKGKDTRRELAVRKALYAMGRRYRVHDRSVTGTPDISNRKKRVAPFVDGCFWHGCRKCYKPPTTNPEFWRNKLYANRKRRNNVVSSLKGDGWTILSYWEHDVILDPAPIALEISSHL